MDLPVELKLNIEKLIHNKSLNELKKSAFNLSDKYRTESGQGKRLAVTENEIIAYAVCRMPATFSAVYNAIEYSLQKFNDVKIDSVLDVGAGLGAGTWACREYFNIESYTLFEREPEMIKIGKKLMESVEDSQNNVEWINGDITKTNLPKTYDFVMTSYTLNELNDFDLKNVVLKLWKATNKVLLIVDTGTVKGFEIIKKVKDVLKAEGANLIAPCENGCVCKMSENDWCHFTSRASRSKAHKLLKEGDAPYEDEKYTFATFARNKVVKTSDNYRVLRHPIIEKNKVNLCVCDNGEVKNISVLKSDNNYKKAKKLKCGDVLGRK